MRRIALSRATKLALAGVVLAIAVVGAFLAFGYRQSTASGQTIPFQTLDWGVNGDYSVPANIVINDDTTWSNVFTYAFCRSPYPPPPLCPAQPSVNFTSTTLLAVFSGQRRAVGYTTNITSVSHSGPNIRVDVTLRVPGKTCGVPLALTWPFHIVTIPKTDAHVEFAAKTVVYDC